ncbi:MAG: photosynthetic complex putative assembly protein PuhB [Myxococcota bacterium]
MTDHPDFEPVHGLPKRLPPGEEVLWQGRPSWRSLAQQVFRLRWLTFYFALLVVARIAVAVGENQGELGGQHVGHMIVLFGGCLALLAFIGWLHAQVTVYTITNRRIVMRIGVALSLHLNLPFKRLAAADLTLRKPGDGDVVLRLTEPESVRWMMLWPHARGVVAARPALRSLREPEKVAGILKDAVAAWAELDEGTVEVARRAESSEPAAPEQAAPERTPVTSGLPTGGQLQAELGG